MGGREKERSSDGHYQILQISHSSLLPGHLKFCVPQLLSVRWGRVSVLVNGESESSVHHFQVVDFEFPGHNLQSLSCPALVTWRSWMEMLEYQSS